MIQELASRRLEIAQKTENVADQYRAVHSLVSSGRHTDAAVHGTLMLQEVGELLGKHLDHLPKIIENIEDTIFVKTAMLRASTLDAALDIGVTLDSRKDRLAIESELRQRAMAATSLAYPHLNRLSKSDLPSDERWSRLKNRLNKSMPHHGYFGPVDYSHRNKLGISLDVARDLWLRSNFQPGGYSYFDEIPESERSHARKQFETAIRSAGVRNQTEASTLAEFFVNGFRDFAHLAWLKRKIQKQR